MTSGKTNPPAPHNPPDPAAKALSGALLFLLALLLVLAAFQRQHWDSDIFWALKSGEWIYLNGSVPRTDPFSYTFKGAEWIDFTWGFQAIAWYYFSRLGGWTGLFILQLVVTGATFYFIYLNLRNLTRGRECRAWLPPLVLFLVFINSYPRLFIRPHLFEYFFISLYLLILNLHEGGEGGEGGAKGRSWYVYLLLPLQVLWMNVHSSAILGIFLAGAYAMGSVIDEIRDKLASGGLSLRHAFTGRTKALLFVSLALPAVSLVNPYGLKLLVFPFTHTSGENADAVRHIGEWTKIGITEMLSRFYPYPLNQLAWKALFLGSLVFLVLNFRRIKTRDVIIFLGAAYLSNTHVRWVAQFGYMVAPLLASNIVLYLNGRESRWIRRGSIGVSAALAVMMTVELFSPQVRENYGIGVKSGVYPDGTVEFMKRESIRGNIFNEYVFGGYLIFNYPDLPVFIDGRTPTVYSPYFFWTARLVNTPESWKRLEREHSIDVVLIKHDSAQCENLRKDPTWSPVHFDDVSVLFLKDKPEFRKVIERHGLHIVNPCSSAVKYELPKTREALKGMRDELSGMVYYDGEGAEGAAFGIPASRPHRLLGLVKSELGGEDLEGAVTEFKKSLSVKETAFVYYDLGASLGKLSRHDEAIEAFLTAVKKDKKFKEAYQALGIIYYEKKDYEKAACRLKEYALLADDSAEYNALKTLGLSYFNIQDYPSSLVYLRRAAYLSEREKERGHLYYHIGNSLFELGDLDEGERYYALALRDDPGYREVLASLINSLKAKGDVKRSERLEKVLTRKR